MKKCRLFGKPVDPDFTNILINAVAVMLIYSAHYGSCAIAPIILDSMKDLGGIDDHLLFNGMAVSSLFSVIMCPLITPAIDKFGTRICLIVGGILITSLAPSLSYPIPAIFITFQACNGAGCALLRAASLKFLTDNSPFEKLAEYNGIHWSIFMGCVLVGNSVLLVATGSYESVDYALRLRTCVSLTMLGTLGVLLYIFFLKKSSSNYNEKQKTMYMVPDEDTMLLESTKKPAKPALCSSSCESLETELDEELDSSKRYIPIFLEPVLSQPAAGIRLARPSQLRRWDSTRQLARWSTLKLVVVMMNCAVFPCLFTTLGPMFIGQMLDDKRYVALFGVCAGIGEIAGSLLAGKVVTRLGIKKAAGVVTAVGLSSVVMAALAFPLKAANPLISPNPFLLLLLGITLGMGDATNGVILSTLIGRIYKSYSQAGFALYSCIFNMFAIVLYIISSYCYFASTVWVMVVVVCGSLGAILLLKRNAMQNHFYSI